VSGAPGRLGRWIRAPLRLIPRSAVVRVLRGPLRGARWAVDSGPHGYWLGSYEPDNQRRAARLAGRAQVVYDVGANSGLFTLIFARAVGEGGTVVAVEPHPENLGRLRRNLELNAVTNVRVVPRALSDRRGDARFAASGNMGRLDEAGRETVEVSTLDHEVLHGGLPAPRLVKMDIEGEEAKALEGAVAVLARHRPVLWIETHGWSAHEACRRRIEASDYRVVEEKPTGESGYGILIAEPSKRSDGHA
jgi:FkbM family methyltransferase